MLKSNRVTSDEAMVETRGVNSGGLTVDEEDHQPTQDASDLPACGLLRIEDKLWLLASELDLAKEEEVVRARVVCLLTGLEYSVGDLPDWEGWDSMVKILES